MSKNLEAGQLRKIAGLMEPKQFKQGECIIRYGDDGMTYFVLSKGNVKVTVYESGTDPNDPEINTKVVITKILESGEGFGELALLYNDKRSATITAESDCSVFTLDGKIFKAMIIRNSMTKRNIQYGFLDGIKLFSTLDKFQKLKLVDGLQAITAQKDEIIIKEGDAGKEFFIIEEGELECLKLHQVGDRYGFIRVRTLNKGEHFGELALINNNVRSMSIKCITPCKLLSLDRESFTRILGSIEQNLAKDYNNEF